MNSKLKHGSSQTNVETIIHQALERDQGDLKSSDRKENSEWLWVFRYGKMVEVDSKGRVLKASGGEMPDEEKGIFCGLDSWIG